LIGRAERSALARGDASALKHPSCQGNSAGALAQSSDQRLRSGRPTAQAGRSCRVRPAGWPPDPAADPGAGWHLIGEAIPL
jgi:hypothetical protein